ncbi:MAG: hypothetical protein Q4C91_07935 [Eubacteriales bacterium]|nr:hypothetical protein [Eubacteriales bacterium]
MSGPKISVYSLTGHARAIVMGQIRCEQQSLACAEQTREILHGLQTFSGDFEREVANIQLLMRRTAEGADQIEKLRQLKEKLSKEATAIQEELKNHMPHASQKYRISEEAYAEKQAELKILQAIRKRAETLQGELNAVFSQDKKNTLNIQASILNDLGMAEGVEKETQTLDFMMRDKTQNIERIQASIIDDISGIYSFDLSEEVQVEQVTSLENKKADLSLKLVSLLNDNVLPDNIVVEIQQAEKYLQKISNIQYLSTFEAVTLSRLKQRIADYNEERNKYKKEFDNLRARYKALCNMEEEIAKEYDFTEESLNILNTEIIRLEHSLIKQREQEYINECVNEVMTEMGYDLIGERSVKKRSGKRFKNELFTFHEGTAVNVTYSSEGQISMELGRISREDRIPNSEECEMLTRDMESFCSEFTEFENRLRAKGVVVNNRIALYPPSAEYAAIINVSDYDVVEGAQITEIKSVERKKKIVEKKVIRRNE